MNSYPTEIKSIILASLLHDIGKFGQRAGAPRSEEMAPFRAEIEQRVLDNLL
jgi:CRISPR/Cas system-associated protein Cas10 (large subunit of type III CRISPR-Cas system)